MDHRGQRRRLSVDARRAEILDAAVALTHEVGLTGLTHALIRDRAEISAGLVNHYFVSLDGIRVAAFHAIFDAVESEPDASPTAQLIGILGAFAATDSNVSARVWVDALQLGRHDAAMQEAVLGRMAADRSELTAVIQAGCRTGEFHTPDPERSARRILVVLDGYLMQFLIAEEHEVRAALRQVVWDLAEQELSLGEGALGAHF